MDGYDIKHIQQPSAVKLKGWNKNLVYVALMFFTPLDKSTLLNYWKHLTFCFFNMVCSHLHAFIQNTSTCCLMLMYFLNPHYLSNNNKATQS